MTSAVMSFGSQLSNGRTGSSHDTSVEVCEEECAHVSLSESLVEVQSMLALFYQNVGVLGAVTGIPVILPKMEILRCAVYDFLSSDEK